MYFVEWNLWTDVIYGADKRRNPSSTSSFNTWRGLSLEGGRVKTRQTPEAEAEMAKGVQSNHIVSAEVLTSALG